MRLQLVAKIGDEHTTLSVAQFGSNQRQDKTLDLRQWAFEPDKEDPVSSLGIRPRGPQIEPVLSEVQVNPLQVRQVCKQATGSLKSMVSR